MERPFASARIDDLESEFRTLLDDKAGLQLLHAELVRRRSTARIEALKAKTWARLREPKPKSVVQGTSNPSQQSSESAPMPTTDTRAAARLDPKAAAFLDQTIGRLREKLIDISKKNPLIAFKHSERGASFLRIIDEPLAGLFEGLRDGQIGFEPLPDPEAEPSDQKTPTFMLALEEARLTDPTYLAEMGGLGEAEADAEKSLTAERGLIARVRDKLGLPRVDGGKRADPIAIARANNINPSFDLPIEVVNRSPADDKIRVLLLPDKLEGRLRTIYDRYRGHAAETGIHTLQLAVSFIEWQEAGSEEVRHHAPLLLMPVHLRRETRRGKVEYALSGEDENLVVNMAAQELLRRNFGIVLPEIGPDEGPEAYLSEAMDLFSGVKGLSLRTFATLAVLPFPNMALWKDLDPEVWPDDALRTHAQIGVLLGAREAESLPSGYPPDYPIEVMAQTDVPPLVLQADVSQHSALLDVSRGNSLALEGPPGTGKSQTIANMIAGGLSQGKRILFVAEKLAALKVVGSRLNAIGLGPLTLELHSDKATKGDVIESLRKGLNLRQQPQGGLRNAAERATSVRDELSNRRDTLRLYRSLLRHPVGALGSSVADLIWREMRLRAEVETHIPRAVWDMGVVGAEEVTALTLERAREALKAVENTARAIDQDVNHTQSPWRAAAAIPPTPIGQSDLGGQLADVEAALRDLLAWSSEFPEMFDGASLRLDALLGELVASEDISSERDIPARLMQAAIRDPQTVKNVANRLKAYTVLRGRLKHLHDRPEDLDPVAILAAHKAIGAIPDEGPRSLDLLYRRREERQAQLAAIQSLHAARETLASLGLGWESLRPSQLSTVTKAISKLIGLSDEQSAMRCEALLGDDAGVILASAAAQAQQLVTKRNEASEVAWSTVTPSRFDAIADAANTLESTPSLLRVFSGTYKQARALARETLSNVPTEGHAIAGQLRTAVNLARELEVFRNESAARSLFGSAWRGYDSDFAQLQQVRDLLRSLELTLRREKLDLAPRLAAASHLELQLWADGLACSDFEKIARLETPFVDAERSLGLELSALDEAIHLTSTCGVRASVELADESVSDLVDLLGKKAALDGTAADLDWFEGSEAIMDQLSRAVAWSDALRKAGASSGLLKRLGEHPEPAAEAMRYRELYKRGTFLRGRLQDRWDRFGAACETRASEFFGSGGLTGTDLRDLLATVQLAQGDSAAMRLYADMGRNLRECDELDARWLFDEASRSGSTVGLANAYELALIRSLLKVFLRDEGQDLERLSGMRLEDASERFRALDETLAKLEALRILAERSADLIPRGRSVGPKSEYTDLALVENELAKQKRHIPVRDLFRRAHLAVQAIKPVWMMSPTTVAQYSPPGGAHFDLVIVDEASQMTPEMAIGALARGGQIVVVGDPKQLPPFDQFKVAANDIDDDDGADIDAESILDLAFAKLATKRRLKWHYRSQHERLIQFSNREFYDQELVVFPSAITGDDFLGVRSEFVGGLYQSRVNPKEAEAVIEAAVGLMASRPELSLGIVTMNSDQRELIFQTFEDVKAQHPVVRDYIQRWEGTIEEFFIKNLENVQGDERDVMIISTLYGPAEPGGRTAQRFGLFVRKDGHRRLNVLMTRAKRANWVFTSMRPNDVVVGPTSSRGVQSLQRLLAYADNAPSTDADSGHELAEPESDFELFVAERLRGHGYEVVYQVGVDRYRIDLGIRHAAYPGGFLAGVECDGASYHSEFTVRDRDRIRQAVLEGLGWKIWRVWSTDWFNDPDRETGRLVAWLDQLRDEAFARQKRNESASDDLSAVPPPPTARHIESTATPDRAETTEKVLREKTIPTPSGRAHKTPEGHVFTEVAGIQGLYEVWLDDRLIGTVERLGSSDAPARLFGGKVVAPKPQFAAVSDVGGGRKITDDLYEAVRLLVKIVSSTDLEAAD